MNNVEKEMDWAKSNYTPELDQENINPQEYRGGIAELAAKVSKLSLCSISTMS